MLNTKYFGLKNEPNGDKNKPWDIICFSDSDYTSNPDTRRSVSGFILFILGVPVYWRLSAHRWMTLSTSKEEWLVLSQAVKEVMFIIQLLKSMKISVKLPVIVHVDNVGAMFMASNVTTTARLNMLTLGTSMSMNMLKME